MVTLLVLRMMRAITRKTPVKTLRRRSTTFNETGGGDGGGGAIYIIDKYVEGFIIKFLNWVQRVR